MQENQPRVGIGIMIFKEGKVLFGKRKGSHGEGEYSLPGGHLEYGETMEECIRRETREECGIEIDNVRFQLLRDVMYYMPKHYVQVGFIADWKEGIPAALEPEKFYDLDWYDLSHLPEPLFGPSKNLIESYKSGKNYYSVNEA
jgi:8-oxo-dGTP diphosphatase